MKSKRIRASVGPPTTRDKSCRNLVLDVINRRNNSLFNNDKIKPDLTSGNWLIHERIDLKERIQRRKIIPNADIASPQEEAPTLEQSKKF